MAGAASRPSHTPRKKNQGGILAARSSNGALLEDGNAHHVPAFPLAAFLLPAKGTVSPWVSIALILLTAALFRWALGFWGFSGRGERPQYGDFEAQRHWMELTINLPVSHWYFYDLQWWGLDYPPLTAYHSWLLGRLGTTFNDKWFSLSSSRGLEDQSLKIFMRASVLASEYLVYVPAVIVCTGRLARLSGVNQWEALVALAAVLMQPATLLIDHGHFQYNTVMLGFVVASMAAILRGDPARSCVYFVAALGFKQMALFYAPAVFAYLLGACLFPRVNIGRFVNLALTTLLSFGVLYAPFVLGVYNDYRRRVPPPTDHETPPLLLSLLAILPFQLSEKSLPYAVALQISQSVHRIFPFARGLFEDKVANIWCAIHSSGLHKLHQYDTTLLSRAALLLTLVAITPPCLIIFSKPKRVLVPWAFATCAWGFFLCSYQVHEKNDLVPLLPMTILLATERGLSPEIRAWVGLANILGAWTLFPLLKRDELRVPYHVLTLLWIWLLGLPPTSLSAYVGGSSGRGLSLVTKASHLLLYLVMLGWHVGEAFVAAPADKPDLWVVLNAIVGAGGFGLCYLWCLWNLMVRSELFSSARAQAPVAIKFQ